MRTAAVLVCLCAFAALAPAQVVINEFVYDDSGTDNLEFCEIYNAGPTPIDISGWTLENRDGTTTNNGLSLMNLATVPATTILPAGGFYVFGNTAVPNVNQVIAANAFENDEEVLILRNAAGVPQDSAHYEANQQQAGFPYYGTSGAIPVTLEGTGIWGNQTANDAALTSWSRYVDGADSNDNGRDFGMLPATPGASNAMASLLPLVENFDGITTETAVPNWAFSFVGPHAINPTVLSTHNPNPIAVASPQGGNALVLMDQTGGGTMAVLRTAATADALFEAYVYLDTSRTGADFETWSIGVRGTTDSFHNHPLPNPNSEFQNSNTGIAWEYISFAGGGTLQLVDEKSGGPTQVTLASYAIQAGVNDGWQRIRLNVSGDVVEAIFGGAWGSTTTGARTLALTSAGQVGAIYMGYREFVLANAQMRPLMVDELLVAAGSTPMSTFVPQPTGAGSLALENRGLTPGLETWNIVSFEPCPGGPGTGPYFGLCAADFNTLLNQFLLPAGAIPFHFFAAGSSFSFGPLGGIPTGLPIEVLTFQVGPSGILFAPVASIVTL